MHTNSFHATALEPGMCAGFKADSGDSHQLVNGRYAEALYLEFGGRMPGDEAVYPDDALKALLHHGQWTFVHKEAVPTVNSARPQRMTKTHSPRAKTSSEHSTPLLG